jgi:hypothetical protein
MWLPLMLSANPVIIIRVRSCRISFTLIFRRVTVAFGNGKDRVVSAHVKYLSADRYSGRRGRSSVLVNASIAIAESNAKSSKRVWEGIELMTEILDDSVSAAL